MPAKKKAGTRKRKAGGRKVKLMPVPVPVGVAGEGMFSDAVDAGTRFLKKAWNRAKERRIISTAVKDMGHPNAARFLNKQFGVGHPGRGEWGAKAGSWVEDTVVPVVRKFIGIGGRGKVVQFTDK